MATGSGEAWNQHRCVSNASRSCNRERELTRLQDDPANATDTYGRFFSFRHPGTPTNEEALTKHSVSPNLTMDDASRFVLTHTPSSFQRMIERNYSYGFSNDPQELARNDQDHTKVCFAKPASNVADDCAFSGRIPWRRACRTRRP